MSNVQSGPEEKRRRITRACDQCRRKKVKCAGECSTSFRCQTCDSLNINCTWNDAPKRRGPRPQDDLAVRIANLEAALQVANGSIVASSSASYSAATSQATTPGEDQEGEDREIELLSERVRRMEIDAFSYLGGLGASSGGGLVEKVVRLKAEHSSPGGSMPRAQVQPDFWEAEVYGRLREWQLNVRYTFPEADLLPMLVEAYMVNYNIVLPLLHRPSFEQSITEGLHLRDPSFGAVVLMVCALGARYVDDVRVCVPGQTMRSAGWRWFNQVDISRRDLFRPPRLFDIQAYTLASWYGGLIFKTQLVGLLIGIAIRMLQQVGAHTKKVYKPTPNAHDELWKRCFWVVFVSDVAMSSEIGRPCGWSEDDIDVDLPVDCDDEYWNVSDPDLPFRQPEGKPSRLSYFRHTIQLKTINLRAMRRVFVGGSPPRLDTSQEALAEIDSELNSWRESLPAYLQWDAVQSMQNIDPVVRRHAARLKVEHNHMLIVLHRSLITIGRSTSASTTSLAICTNAARANARLFEHCVGGIHMIAPVLSAAGVLLLSLWGAKKMNIRVDHAAVLSDVKHCRDILVALEASYQMVEQIRQNLDDLTAHHDEPGTADHLVGAPKRSFSDTDFMLSDLQLDVPQGTSVMTDATSLDPLALWGHAMLDTNHSLAYSQSEILFGQPVGAGDGWETTHPMQARPWGEDFLPLWMQAMSPLHYPDFPR